MTQLLYEGDRILGMTTAFQYTVDGWKSYLGAKTGNARADSENSWNNLYSLRGDIRARMEKGSVINLANPKEDFDLIAKGYEQTRKYVDTMVYMLQNDAVGGGLSQAMQDGWMLSWNGFRSAIGGAEGGFSAWRGQTLTFLDGYKNTELATSLAVAVQTRALTSEEQALIQSNSDLRITYENLKLTLSDQIKSAKLGIEQAESSYNNARAILDATLIQLDASRKNAEIALEQAKRDYAKLRVVAPVSGNIGKVIANVGQSVNIGSPIAEFTSNQPQISVDIDTALAETLSI
jgi:biotin carboxyl carrier protein